MAKEQRSSSGGFGARRQFVAVFAVCAGATPRQRRGNLGSHHAESADMVHRIRQTVPLNDTGITDSSNGYGMRKLQSTRDATSFQQHQSARARAKSKKRQPAREALMPRRIFNCRRAELCCVTPNPDVPPLRVYGPLFLFSFLHPMMVPMHDQCHVTRQHPLAHDCDAVATADA